MSVIEIERMTLEIAALKQQIELKDDALKFCRKCMRSQGFNMAELRAKIDAALPAAPATSEKPEEEKR